MADWAVKCNFCGRKDQELKRCTKCYSVHYCSRACQSIDWPNHKKICCKSKTPKANVMRDKGIKKPDELLGSTNKGIKQSDAHGKKTNANQPENTSNKMYNICESRSNSACLKKVMATEYDQDSLKESQTEQTSHRDKTQIQAILETSKSETSKIKEHRTAASDKTDIPCEKQASDDEPSVDDPDKKKQNNNFKKEGVCHYCLSEGSKLRCTGCSNTFYCSKECQKRDWQHHKIVCGSLQRKKEKSPTVKSLQTNNEQSSEDFAGVAGAEGGANKGNFDEKEPVGICFKCAKPGCSKRCSRCREVFYCSRQCQQEDWSRHKQVCEQKFTDEEQRIIDERLRQKKEDRKRMHDFAKPARNERVVGTISNFEGGLDRILAMLTPEQALIDETRPPGSLNKAARFARILYPGFNIILLFEQVPREALFPWEIFHLLARRPCVLVAFMFKYHEHVMRHGVYLKDAIDQESKVEFYLDEFGDSPYPFFTYEKVKPGNYICLEKPEMHLFLDGSVGIKIQNPREVSVIEKHMLDRG